MFKHFAKIIIIYLITLTAALAVFFYIQNRPADLARQILNSYQYFIWFNPAESANNSDSQKIKQIMIADLEPLGLSLIIKVENYEYLPKIEKIIKTAANQKISLKFPQTEEIILPDKTTLKQKVAKPADFVWYEEKIKPGFTLTWLQKEDNYFGYITLDLIDQNGTNRAYAGKILALTIDKNVLENLDPNELILKLENGQNLFYADDNFLTLLQENSDDNWLPSAIKTFLIRGDQDGFSVEVK